MKIFVFNIMYNESVIVPHFVRHYSGFADKIVMNDNMSTDNTRELIKQYDIQNKCTIVDFITDNKLNDERYLEVKHNCWKPYREEADWIMVVDCDEFVYHPNIIQFLKKAKDDGYTCIIPTGYNMISNEAPVHDKPLFEQIRDGALAPNFSKLCIFNPKEIQELNYSFGCHGASPVGNVKMLSSQEIKLLHYRLLGPDYIYQRNRIYAQRLSEFNLSTGAGFHYRWSKEEMLVEYNDFKSRIIRNVI